MLGQYLLIQRFENVCTMAELPVSDPLEQFRERASNKRGIDMSKQGIEHCIQDWRVPFTTSVLNAYKEE